MTLVELIVAVAIVAVLGAFALPNYFEYQQRARRVDAKMALQKIANNQERFYASNFSYTSDLSRLGFSDNRTENGYYVVSVPMAGTLGFQAVAVPAPGSSQAKDDDCVQFTIDNQRTRGALPDPDGKCW